MHASTGLWRRDEVAEHPAWKLVVELQPAFWSMDKCNIGQWFLCAICGVVYYSGFIYRVVVYWYI